MNFNYMENENLEFCLLPANPAVLQARKLINKVSVPRAEKEDKILEMTEHIKEYVICCNCSRRGDKTPHEKSEMMALIRYGKVKGRKTKVTQYLCPACAAKYKPQSERVGCRTY